MHRFYLPPQSWRATPLLLEGREAHHGLHVLRLREGDTLELLDGAGRRCRGAVQALSRDQIVVTCLETHDSPRPDFHLHLIQAIPKGKTIESIIQKATELSVSTVTPLLSERVITRLNEEERLDKMEKWQQIAIEAMKQCGTAWLPKVEKPLTPHEFLAKRDTFELPLIACLQTGSRHPREAFLDFQKTHRRKPSSICIWIGPEGDFTPDEVNAIKSSGAFPISLGPLVLRSETAAIFCLSVINYELSAAGS